MMNLTCLFRVILVICILIRFTRNAVLSPAEQKKYKGFLEGQGLYTADDDVAILSVHNFHVEVYGASHALLVEFYNSWCGYCQRFAPSWKALATDVRAWNDLVVIGAIDCADDDNAKICREFEIMAYPSLRYFHENYEEKAGNFGDKVTKGQDLDELKYYLMEKIIQEKAAGRGHMYPDLKPFTGSDVLSIIKTAPEEIKYGILVIEKPNQYLGMQLALDFHKIHDLIIRFSYDNNTALMEKMSLPSSPSLIIFDRNDILKVVSEHVHSREALKMAVKLFLTPRKINVPDETTKQDLYKGNWADNKVPDMESFMEARAKEALKDKVKKMGDVVFQMDLETALRYSLKHEVSNDPELSGEKLEALQAYLAVLAKYFPFGPKGRIFLDAMIQTVTSIAFSEGRVKGAVLRGMVEEAELEESQVFSSLPDWLGCMSSVPSRRGYPCGMWKLFHYLSVNAAEYNRYKKLANPREVLDAMHGYIKNFFGCADCSQNFLSMAHRRNLNNVSTPDSAVIWLWMAHNEVNKRLAGDATEDPEYPKVQFPLKENCPLCKNTDDTWNLAAVHKYLMYVYSNVNVRYIGSDTRILHLGLEGSQVYSGSSLFHSLDAGLCFILYVVSFLLLMVLVKIFLKKSYRKKLYVHDLLGKV